MAVKGRTPRPLRALVLAHLAGSHNQLRRQFGPGARLWLRLFGALTFALTMLPLAGLAGLMGYLSVSPSGLDPRTTDALFASLLTVCTILLGLSAGLVAGSRGLPWSALASFPVPPRTLFAAELGAAALDLESLLALCLLLAAALGATAGAPASAPFYLLLFVVHALMLLAVQQIVASLVQRLTRRLRATALMSSLIGLVVFLMAPALAGSASREGAAILTALGSTLAAYAPAGSILEVARASRRGTLTPPLLLAALLHALWVVGALLGLARILVARERPLVRSERSRPARPFHFDTQVGGIARLTFQSLLHSLPGRYAIAMPLLAVVLFRGPMLRLTGTGWSVPVAAAYASLGGANLLFNQFGLDRHGVKVLLLLPIGESAILRGKRLGFALFHALAAALFLLLLGLVGGLDGADAVAALLVFACIFAACSAIGRYVSVWNPRPLSADSLRRTHDPSAVRLLALCATLAVIGLVSLPIAVARAWAPGRELALLGGLALILAAIDELSLARCAHYLARHRERLVERLGEAV